MKKVIALALAVLMLATIAFAVPRANVSPGTTIKISRDGIKKASGTTITIKTEGGDTRDLTGWGENALDRYIPRSVNSNNYSVTNVKFKQGKGLVEKVEINDVDDCVDIIMADDLTNTKSVDFEVSFKLKGKAKYSLKDSNEVIDYNDNQIDKDSNGNSKFITPEQADYSDVINTKVSLPDLDFNVAGTVGYGLVTVYIGTDNDEEIEGLESLLTYVSADDKQKGVTPKSYLGIDPKTGTVEEASDILDGYIFKFSTSATEKSGTMKEDVPMAGAYTADTMLTQEYGDALTLEARVYHNDKLYFGISNTPKKAVINRMADSDGDLDFFLFNTNKEYTTFNSNVKIQFNDADEDCFVYKINDNGYLVPTGEYSEEDGCWIVKTRTLGQYVVSDIELQDNVIATDDTANGNPDTGANDVVGIATALAAVALVSAAAISLKK